MGHYDCKRCHQRECVCPRLSSLPEREYRTVLRWSFNHDDLKVSELSYKEFLDEPGIYYIFSKVISPYEKFLKAFPSETYATEGDALHALAVHCFIKCKLYNGLKMDALKKLRKLNVKIDPLLL